MMIKFIKNNPIVPVMIVLLMIAGFVVPTKAPTLEENAGGPQKYTDYKFRYILRLDDVHIDEAAVRFYEGHYETRNGTEVYIRERKIPTTELVHLENKKFHKDPDSGEKVMVYTKDDFGNITTDDELRLFLNKEIAKDKGRIVIPEQREILDVRKVK